MENKIAELLEKELDRINETWGDQHHLDGTGDDFFHLMANRQRKNNDALDEQALTWQEILAEEYYEACAEADSNKLVSELIQVAAVALSWVRDILGRERERAN